jgi:hypothetical protein
VNSNLIKSVAIIIYIIALSITFPIQAKDLNADEISPPTVYDKNVEIALHSAMTMHTRTYPKKNCFQFYIEVKKDNIVISIFSKIREMDDGDLIKVKSGFDNYCGNSFSYIFGKDGKFQKRVGVR